MRTADRLERERAGISLSPIPERKDIREWKYLFGCSVKYQLTENGKKKHIMTIEK